MNFEPLKDEDANVTELSPYSPAEIRRMKDELKTNRARSRMLRFELERKRRFRNTLEAKQRKKAEALKREVEHLEKVRANMETKANDKRRDDDMHEIGQLLLHLNKIEEKVVDVKNLSERDRLKLREQDKQLREVESEFRNAPDDINKVALKKQRITESRFLIIQRKHNRLRKQAVDAQDSVRGGMKERQTFHEAYIRIERQYSQNAKILKQMLDQITKLNDKRSEFLKKASQNRNASNDTRDEVVVQLRTAERMANVERETRILSVHRAIDRTPYWKNDSVNQAVQSFWKKPVRPQVTMQKTIELEGTMATLRQICNVENMSDVIDLYKTREENNELLAQRLRDLNAEAERLVDRIEVHYKALNKVDEKATEGETTAERKIMMLLEKTRVMETNETECKNSLQAFRDFYNNLGPKMTQVHELMFKLVPHGSELKRPASPCSGENYREYQMSFARLAHYFHAIFDYWKQQEHERKCRTDPLYTGNDDDDSPLALRNGTLAKSDYPVAAKLKLLPKNLCSYIKRNQFENEDGTPAIMTVKSMDFFAKTEAAELLQLQTQYLDALDEAEGKRHRGSISVMDLLPLAEYVAETPNPSDFATQTDQGQAAGPLDGLAEREECELTEIPPVLEIPEMTE